MPGRRLRLGARVQLVGHAPAPSPLSAHAFVRLSGCPFGRLFAFRTSRAFNRDDAFAGVAGFAASCPVGRKRAFAAIPASRSVARERAFAGIPTRRPIGGQGACAGIAGLAAHPVDGQRSLAGAAAFGRVSAFRTSRAFNRDDAFAGVAAGLALPACLPGFARGVGAGLGTSCHGTGRTLAAGEAGDRSGRGVITVEGAARAVAGHCAILPQPA
ncbi:hypothetical protein L3Q67_27155 [Saccharothrix sp. AJ9571]|nr:hypothetical protein L3Q67_27155 [Saccharothrix sp. AJ9571]